MTETLRKNPEGLDLKQSPKNEVIASMWEKIWTTFESAELAKAYFAESMWSDLHEEWRKDNRFHKWPEKEFIKWETVIKINWIEYVFNGVKDGIWEFIITDAWKKAAQQLWKDYEDSIQYDYSPRMKKSKDPEWTEKHGTDDVDIANTKFAALPSNWKYENLEAAKVAIDLVFDYVIAWKEITDEIFEEMAAVVHDKWLERNPWEKDGKLWVPYDQLSDDEKEKDRAHVRQAIAKIKSGK